MPDSTGSNYWQAQKKMTKDNPIAPRIALLGLCERARYQRGDPAYLSQIDILGLRKVVLAYIYPFDTSGLFLTMAAYGMESSNPGAVVLRNRDGVQVFRVDIRTNAQGDTTLDKDLKNEDPDSGAFAVVGGLPSWTVFLAPLKGIVLNQPQTLEAFLLTDDQEIPLGVFSFGLAGAPPLTPDRIAAIKSDPRALKTVYLILGCKHCDSKLKVVAALEKPEKSEGDGVWYQDLQSQFTCSCGKTNISLDILKSNMHALLGKTDIAAKNLSFSTLYEHDAIERVSGDFLQLVRTSPREEDIQQFLAKNPIVFHFLSPVRIFEKPPILSKHQADFAIRSHSRIAVSAAVMERVLVGSGR